MPISPKLTLLAKEMEKGNRKTKEKERRRKETSNSCTLSCYIDYIGYLENKL